jgi:hypothetical protein
MRSCLLTFFLLPCCGTLCFAMDDLLALEGLSPWERLIREIHAQAWSKDNKLADVSDVSYCGQASPILNKAGAVCINQSLQTARLSCVQLWSDKCVC